MVHAMLQQQEHPRLCPGGFSGVQVDPDGVGVLAEDLEVDSLCCHGVRRCGAPQGRVPGWVQGSDRCRSTFQHRVLRDLHGPGGHDAEVGSTDDFYCDEVLSGRTKVTVVTETDRVLAYHHTRPFWPVHIVVIPKMHVPSLTDLSGAPEGLLADLLEVVREVAAEVERRHGAARVLTNLGAYQDSKHLHFHVNSGEPLRG